MGASFQQIRLNYYSIDQQGRVVRGQSGGQRLQDERQEDDGEQLLEEVVQQPHQVTWLKKLITSNHLFSYKGKETILLLLNPSEPQRALQCKASTSPSFQTRWIQGLG